MNSSNYETPESLKKVWRVEMDLLQKLLDVCRQMGLTCWVDGGTMLGTVRHKGFIPWDDDADIAMTRKDFEVFRKVARTELKDGFVYVDMDDKGQGTKKRYKKASYEWMKTFLETKGSNLD